jgi:hypothetical protein
MELTLEAEFLHPSGRRRRTEVQALLHDFRDEQVVRLSVLAKDDPWGGELLLGTFSRKTIAAWHERGERELGQSSYTLGPEGVARLHALLNPEPLVATPRGRVSALAA